MEQPNEFSGYSRLNKEYISSIHNFLKNTDILIANFEILKDDYIDKRLKCKNSEKKSLETIETEYEQEKEKLEIKKKKLIGEINRYNLIFEEGTTKYGKITPEIAQRIQELRDTVDEFIDANIADLTHDFEIKTQKVKEQFQKALSSLEVNFEMVAKDKASDVINYFENALVDYENIFNQKVTSKDEDLINKDISVFDSSNFSPLFEIGTFDFEVNLYDSKLSKKIKILVPFLDNNSVLIIHDNNTIAKAEHIHDTLLTRALLCNEVGKIKLTLSDLKGLGDFYREFKPLTEEVAKISNGKSNFEKILTECADRIQNISDRYTISSKDCDFLSLGAYNYFLINQNKNEETIPHYLSVVLNLSYEADDALVRKLNQLITNGNKNGTQFLITWNKDDEDDKNVELLKKIIANPNVVTIDFVGKESNYLGIEHTIILNQIPEEKKHELVASYNHQFKELTNNVVKEHFFNVLPDKTHWFSLDSSELIRVPIGKSKNHRGEQVVELKTNDFQSHLMLSGGTGSGKTNFLKTFITSSAINYSPDDLEFYLIDLKNGIGFDIFRKFQLPHVKMFAMGAENELILNVLEELNDEMNRRLNLFTENGVDDIAKYNKVNSNNKIKRTLLVVDEFSTIFEDGNPYQDEIVSRISPLARKGRAAGINLFFSTQNFNAVSHGFSKLKTEIPVRIVLKSSLDAASALLDSRNDAMKWVNTVGDGVLNYRLGNKLEEKDNEFFKGYLLENEDLEKILIEIKNESQRRNFQDNELTVYNNIELANFKKNVDIFKQKRLTQYIDEEGTISKPTQYKKLPIWLGESTTLSKSHFKIELEKNFNENIFVTGIDKSVSINAIFNILSSVSYALASGEVAIRVFSFLNEEDNKDLQLFKLDQLSAEYDYKFLTVDNYADEFQNLYAEYEQRNLQNTSQAKRIFAIYIGLEKAKDFFKADTWTMSEKGEQFQRILENGTAYNIHSVAEARLPSILSKIIAKSDSVGLFKHRIVFHLGSSDESSIVLDSKLASNLYKKDEPHTKCKAIYYNAEFEKEYHKIKPYIGLIESEDFVPYEFGNSYLNNEVIIQESTCSDVQSEIELEKPEPKTDESLDTINQLKEMLDDDDDDEIIDIDEF